MKGYTLAIIGARGMKSDKLFTEGVIQVIEKWGLPTNFVSGGAKGADTMGEEGAKQNKINSVIYKPNYDKYGRRAPLERNKLIVNDANKVLAFPSKSGSGTQHSISLAKKQKKDVLVIWID